MPAAFSDWPRPTAPTGWSEPVLRRKDARHFGDGSYPTVKRILAEGLDADAVPTVSGEPATPVVFPAPHAYTFVRQAGELVAALLGAVR